VLDAGSAGAPVGQQVGLLIGALEMAAAIAAKATLSLNLLLEKDKGSKKRGPGLMSGPEKIESIYAGLDSIGLLMSLIRDTSLYLEFIDNSLQGVDVLKMLKSYKGKVMQEMKNRWIDHLPIFINEMLEHGHIREETFESLGYPIDADPTGKQYPLPEASRGTQHHRMRFEIMTHPNNISRFE